MPQKMIYIREEDLELFEKAQSLAGESLSGVIAEALRQYVKKKEAEAEGFEEVTLEVGYWPPRGAKETKKIRFTGKSLAWGQKFTGQTGSRDDRGTDYEIYLTKKGKYLLYWHQWSRWQNEGSNADYALLSSLPKPGEEVEGELGDRIVFPASVLEEAGGEVVIRIE